MPPGTKEEEEEEPWLVSIAATEIAHTRPLKRHVVTVQRRKVYYVDAGRTLRLLAERHILAIVRTKVWSASLPTE